MLRHNNLAKTLVVVVGSLLPAVLTAQRVLLELRPRRGDTLCTRLDQQTETTRSRHSDGGAPEASVVSTMQMFSRAIVESTAGMGANVLAITDSVLTASTDSRAQVLDIQTKRMLEGKRVRLLVMRDGTVQMIAEPAGAGAPALSETVSIMPPPFPREPVIVGDSWVREMPLPREGNAGARSSPKLRAVFRLDSLSRDGGVAFISMRGEMTAGGSASGGVPAGPPGQASSALGGEQDGTVMGSMQLDRRRGWLSESRFTIVVHSTLPPSEANDAAPTHYQMKITQRTRTAAKH